MDTPELEQKIQALIQENKTLAKKLALAEKGRKRTEEFKNQNHEVLVQVNKKLTKTLDELKEAQVELIHQEKMAGLGQLVAGISHEINTPAGAIMNSILELRKDYKIMLVYLVKVIYTLPPELLPNFLDSANIVTKLKIDLGTKQEREVSKDLAQILEVNTIEVTTNFIRNLATIGFNKDNIETLLPLMKTPRKRQIYETLFLLGMNAIHVRDIQIGIQKVVGLVKALKIYSHSSGDEFAYTNLDKDILTTLTILHNRLKHGIQVIQEFDPLPEINCYADQLNQVWTNLINNSIEAMNGQGQIIIRLKLLDSEHVKVEIEDNGPGIPELLKPRIYEPYFTTKPKGEGTGLGLSISKAIIEKHHGVIELESVPGKTVFRVILPIQPLKKVKI